MKLNPDEEDPIDQGAIARYLGALFGAVEWQPGESIALRGLGEKGTLAEGLFREQKWVPPDRTPDFIDAAAIAEHADRWRGVNAGAFLIPAVMRRESLENNRQSEADVAWLTSIVVDLDNPDTAEDSLLRLEHALGPAGIVVESSPGKLHAYWLLGEPEDPARVARLRHLLALKAGGDPSFQRIPQVIRIPGTDHQKNGGRFRVWMRHCDPDCRHSISGIEDRIQELHPLPWASEQALSMASQGTLTLSGLEAGNWTAKERLTQDVHAGGQGAATRWDAFSQVAGHHVHSVRVGAIATVEEARDLVRGWMLTHMIPPWPDARFDQEWSAIVRLDVERNGPLAPPARLWGSGQVIAPEQAAPDLPPNDIRAWAVHRWVSAAAPPARKWLVQGLVRAAGTHLLASEGGVGKTFALLDLCMAVADGAEGAQWLGQPIVPEHTGGTAVLLTAEDDQDELHIRIHDMDATGRRFRAADRLIVLPLVQAGGVFPLVEIGAGGTARPNPSWQRMMDALAGLPNLQLVAVDTLAATLHGEENSSIIVQQYMTALALLRTRVPHVATLVTHHVRKQSNRDAPIQSAADMRQAIRGSNALLGAVRLAMGIWQPPDYADRLKRMGKPAKPGTLFHFAVVKANNPEAMADMRTLVRAEHGGLVDATALDRATSKTDEQIAWLVAAVERAVKAGLPYNLTGQNGIAGLRRGELPPALKMNDKALLALAAHAADDLGKLVLSKVGGGKGYLDVPGGPLAKPDPLDSYELGQGAHTPDWTGWTYNRMLGLAQPPAGGGA